MSQRVQSLAEGARWLHADIQRGLFTPFLGAGASSIRSGEVKLKSSPWKEVASTLTAIALRLQTARSRDFLRSFAEYRLSLSAEKVAKIIPTLGTQGKPRKATEDLSRHLLVEFGAELARATVRLTQYFAVQFSRENPSIHNLEHCSVDFDLALEEAGDSLDQLIAVVDIALALCNANDNERESPFLICVPGVDRRLESRRLHQKLLGLVVGLLGTHGVAHLPKLAKHRLGTQFPIPYEIIEGKVPYFGRLRLDAIQWLSDLLWYTVRYWIPSYPTTAELAFELSLAARHAPPGRAELARTAQALENESEGPGLLANIVGDLVTYCEASQEKIESCDKQTITFYYCIAAILQRQFEQHREAVAWAKSSAVQPYKARFQRTALFGDEPRTPPPISFTTNFDNALERVLEKAGLVFHVVFPVLRKAKSDEWRGSPRWLIRTCYPRGQHSFRSPLEKEWSEICDVNGLPTIEFEGPIIVKLHGSPALSLEHGYEHWIVLSEASYLQALRPPSWLEQELRSGRSRRGFTDLSRSLWFLGYSISDLNVRYCLYGEDGFSRESVRRTALILDVDSYQRAIFQELRVTQVVGDLTDLTNVLLDILKLGDIDAPFAGRTADV